MGLKWWLKLFGRGFGAALIAVAVLVVWVDPGVAFVVQRGSVLLFLGIVGVLVLVGLVVYLRVADYSGWNDVGRPPDMPVPLSHGDGREWLVEGEGDLRRELREVVVDRLVRGGLGREEAERVVEAGGWTEDRRAAWWVDEGAPRPSRAVMVVDWLSPEGFRERYVRHALEEIEGLWGDEVA